MGSNVTDSAFLHYAASLVMLHLLSIEDHHVCCLKMTLHLKDIDPWFIPVCQSRSENLCIYYCHFFLRDVPVFLNWLQKYNVSAKAINSTSQVKLGCVLFIRDDSQVFQASGLLQLVIVNVTLSRGSRGDHSLRFSFVSFHSVFFQDFILSSTFPLEVYC